MARPTGGEAVEPVSILLLDDGELSGVAELLDELGLAYTRLRGGESSGRSAPPTDLLIATARRAEIVRRGSPPGTPAGRPVRIIAVEEDSTAMRRMLRRMGFHLLVRLPSDATIWRLLIRRALYQGDERRAEPRVAVGAPVSLRPSAGEAGPQDVTLMDISNRGCRLVARTPFTLTASLSIDLPGLTPDRKPLTLSGRVARASRAAGEFDGQYAASVIFDEDMDETLRARLCDAINRWSMGPPSIASLDEEMPPLPPCRSQAIPGLTLDDETDPSIRVGERVSLRMQPERGAGDEPAPDRRSRARRAFVGTLLATSDHSRRVLLGRDLSARGMRIERLPGLAVGDRFRIALYGPSPLEPFEVSAEVIRDDAAHGLALGFDAVAPSVAEALEKLVACLPEVESLEEEESFAMGAVLSVILDEDQTLG